MINLLLALIWVILILSKISNLIARFFNRVTGYLIDITDILLEKAK